VQQQRDGDRKKILETELVNEERNLQLAKRELAEQENTRLGSERNAQRMLDRIEPFQKKVKLHEDNIANLKKELANLR
jgi:phosphoketolase